MQRTATKTAERLLSAMLANDLDRYLGAFDKDVVFEFPFAPQGRPKRLEGLSKVREYLEPVFRQNRVVGISRWTVHQTTRPEVAVIEFTAAIEQTGDASVFESTYIVVLIVKDDRIALYRDYWAPSGVLGIMSEGDRP